MVIIAAFFVAFRTLYLGNTFSFGDLNGFLDFVSLTSNLLAVILIGVIMIFEKDEALSFKITVLGSAALLLIDPTLAFPALPMIAGIWVSGVLLKLDLSNGESIKKVCAAAYFYIATSAVFIVEKKLSFFPLINIYTPKAFLIVYSAVAASAVITLLIYILLSKLNISRLDYILPALWLLYTLAAAAFIYFNFGDPIIQNSIVASLAGLFITVYRLIARKGS